MSTFVLLYIFIVNAFLLPRSLWADPQYEICKNNQACGNTGLPYPFGVRDSGCGLPDFEIDCEEEVRPVIEIGSQNYTILDFFPNNCTCLITSDKIFKDCNFSYGLFDSTQLMNTTVFDRIHPLNRTLQVYGCDVQCVPYVEYIPGYWFSSCPLKIVTVQEGLAQWNIEQNRLYQNCSNCAYSGGQCGYNTSDSQQFLCFCENGIYGNQCPHEGKKRSNLGVVIGAATGGIALMSIVALLMLAVVYRKRSSSFTGAIEPTDSRSMLKVEKFLQGYIHQMPTRYSFSELKKITNNFADKLGQGGFGVVYKGKLQNGILVAVKVLDQSRHSESQFMNEVETLGTIHHVHLVRLMGYCYEKLRSALVYEYMANGSLEKFIFSTEREVLRWEQLYSIAVGAARGIAYLHDECNRRIIHFDIKPHNILLDADFAPKVADFGLAKLCGKGDDHISITATRGTPGYVAPELWSRDLGPVTNKADVYSFGMLLLEMAGRRRNLDLKAGRSSQLYFPDWAFKLIEKGQLEMRLRERGRAEIELEDEEKVRRVTKVGLWCIQYNSSDRPSMSKVVQMLEGNGDDVSNPPLPFNSSPSPEAPLLSSTQDSSWMV